MMIRMEAGIKYWYPILRNDLTHVPAIMQISSLWTTMLVHEIQPKLPLVWSWRKQCVDEVGLFLHVANLSD